MAPTSREMSEVEGLQKVVRLLTELLDLCRKALGEAEEADGHEHNGPTSERTSS